MSRFFPITKRIFRWVLYIALALVAILFIVIESFDRYVSSEKGTRWWYKDIPRKDWTINYTPSGLRYLEIGDADKQPLLLVHGAPGSVMDWSAMAKRERIYEKYRLLVVDRPGYGGTKPRGAEKDLRVHAEKILEVLEGETQKAVIMGHSYGGPIAVIMGAIQPEKIAKIVGVSGQYDPDNEVTFRISYFLNFKIFRFLLPRMLWVSNVEKLSHPAALRSILPLYAKISVPVVLIHGDADTLVPYPNSPFLMELMKNDKELVTIADGDHPLQMQAPDMLVDFVLNTDQVPTEPTLEEEGELAK
ncbi:MAG: alpha/beta hydrolase [Saprospiraceae bacterium]|nr:alpha/beta hydrolase [Saprospiraceae bacterium]